MVSLTAINRFRFRSNSEISISHFVAEESVTATGVEKVLDGDRNDVSRSLVIEIAVKDIVTICGEWSSPYS